MIFQKKRKTAETELSIILADDKRTSEINTGVGFLNHMLTLFTFHSGLSIIIEANGDTEVDDKSRNRRYWHRTRSAIIRHDSRTQIFPKIWCELHPYG